VGRAGIAWRPGLGFHHQAEPFRCTGERAGFESPAIFWAIDRSREGHWERRRISEDFSSVPQPPAQRVDPARDRAAPVRRARLEARDSRLRNERGGRGVAARGCAGVPSSRHGATSNSPTAKATDPARGLRKRENDRPETNGETEHRARPPSGACAAKPGRPAAVPAFFQRPPRSGGGGASRSPPQVGGAVGLGRQPSQPRARPRGRRVWHVCSRRPATSAARDADPGLARTPHGLRHCVFA
jgi:hypothetical protein